jgi:hypothetical protein
MPRLDRAKNCQPLYSSANIYPYTHGYLHQHADLHPDESSHVVTNQHPNEYSHKESDANSNERAHNGAHKPTDTSTDINPLGYSNFDTESDASRHQRPSNCYRERNLLTVTDPNKTANTTAHSDTHSNRDPAIDELRKLGWDAKSPSSGGQPLVSLHRAVRITRGGTNAIAQRR